MNIKDDFINAITEAKEGERYELMLVFSDYLEASGEIWLAHAYRWCGKQKKYPLFDYSDYGWYFQDTDGEYYLPECLGYGLFKDDWTNCTYFTSLSEAMLFLATRFEIVCSVLHLTVN